MLVPSTEDRGSGRHPGRKEVLSGLAHVVKGLRGFSGMIQRGSVGVLVQASDSCLHQAVGLLDSHHGHFSLVVGHGLGQSLCIVHRPQALWLINSL